MVDLMERKKKIVFSRPPTSPVFLAFIEADLARFPGLHRGQQDPFFPASMADDLEALIHEN